MLLLGQGALAQGVKTTARKPGNSKPCRRELQHRGIEHGEEEEEGEEGEDLIRVRANGSQRAFALSGCLQASRVHSQIKGDEHGEEEEESKEGEDLRRAWA